MAQIIGLPKLSPTMEEGVLAVDKKEGDKVSPGDLVAEVETDKANMDFHIEDDGVLLKLLVKEGDTVKLGAPVAIIGKAGEDVSALVEQAKAQAAAPPPKAEQARGARRAAEAGRASAATSPRAGDEGAAPRRSRAAPRREADAPAPTPAPAPARRQAARLAAREDARDRARHRPAHASPAAAPAAASSSATCARRPRAAVATATRRHAPRPRDRRAVESRSRPAAAIAIAVRTRARWCPTARATTPTCPRRNMRKRIAARLTEAKRDVPHFYLSARSTPRRCSRSASGSTTCSATGARSSVNDLVIKAVALALRRVPDVQRRVGRRRDPPVPPRAHRRRGRDRGRPRHAGRARRRSEGHRLDRRRGPRPRRAREEAQLKGHEITGSTFTRVEPRHVRHRAVHRDHQSARGRHPRDRRGASTRRSSRTARSSPASA